VFSNESGRAHRRGFAFFLVLANYNVWGDRVGPIGIVERVPVYTILAWQIFSAVVLLTRQAARHVD